MIICFVDVSSKSESEIALVYIKEHFLSFVGQKETTGESMTEIVLRQLGNMGLIYRKFTRSKIRQ